ncbi:MAG: hypothetical protein WCA46_11055 [Actinocatenispora sp.]
MGQWMVAVAAQRYQAERLYQRDQLELHLPPQYRMQVGDDVVLTAAGERPVVFGLARVVAVAAADRVADDPDDEPDADGPYRVVVEYTRRLLDRPVPAAEVDCASDVDRARTAPLTLESGRYRQLVARLGAAAEPAGPTHEWMVSLDLPIEASSAAEAVRIFWTYVRQLGPGELPAFVWPRGDETAMRPYVLGAEHDLDPE